MSNITRLNNNEFMYSDTLTGKDIIFTKHDSLILKQRQGNNRPTELYRANAIEADSFIERYKNYKLFKHDTKYLYISRLSPEGYYEEELIYREKGHLPERPNTHRSLTFTPKTRGRKTKVKISYSLQSLPKDIADQLELIKNSNLKLNIPEGRYNSFLLRYLLAFFCKSSHEDRAKIISIGRKEYINASVYGSFVEEDETGLL